MDDQETSNMIRAYREECEQKMPDDPSADEVIGALNYIEDLVMDLERDLEDKDLELDQEVQQREDAEDQMEELSKRIEGITEIVNQIYSTQDELIGARGQSYEILLQREVNVLIRTLIETLAQNDEDIVSTSPLTCLEV